jgi:nitrogen-specific signal transduction histidine kinase
MELLQPRKQGRVQDPVTTRGRVPGNLELVRRVLSINQGCHLMLLRNVDPSLPEFTFHFP